MVLHANRRPATSLRLLRDAAETVGVDPSACFEDTGIVFDDLNDPNVLHSTEQEVRVIENFVRLAPRNVGLGVLVGRHLHTHAFGIWGFAILTSPTLRSAIQTSIDYVKLSFLIAEMTLGESEDKGYLMFDMAGLPPSTHRFILERHTVVAMTFSRDLIQQPDFEGFQIETTDSDPAYALELSAQLKVPVRGGMDRNALTFPVELLDQPLPKSDPASLRFCLDQCKALVEESSGALPPWSHRVREAIIDNIGSEQKIEDIADGLSVTERTLRRRLTDEGTSFRDLYTDARMAIARELLEVAGLNVETVSWRVGYAEPASFVRAFSKKFGTTPGEVRQRKAMTDAN